MKIILLRHLKKLFQNINKLIINNILLKNVIKKFINDNKKK